MLLAATANHQVWHQFKQEGFAAADTDEDSPDISRIDFPSVSDVGLGVTIALHDERHFISDILPNGDAAIDGRLRVGDELVFLGDQPVISLPAGESLMF